MRRGLLIALGFLAVPVLALAGCNALFTARADDHAAATRTLHEEARALVPRGASVVVEEESDCTEFRPSPSCVVVFLDWSGSYAARRAAAAERIRARAWRPAPNAPSFVFERDDLRATLSIHRRGGGWQELCARRDPEHLDRYDRDRCLDQILVSVT